MAYPRKTALTILAFAALAALPEFVPEFRNYRIVEWASIPAVIDFSPRTKPAEPLAEEEARLRPDLPERPSNPGPGQAAPRVVGRGLDHFYEALRLTEAQEPGAVTRILHYGDSPTTADLITADTRALLQKQFGDAGHGFVLLARPWAWYGHRGVEVSGSGWRIDPANQSSIRDGLYGLGGVSFRGSPGARSTIVLADADHRMVDVSYLQSPGAGSFELWAGDTQLGVVDTAGASEVPAFRAFALPPSTTRLQVRVVSGSVRLFGLVFSKDNPGVVYNSLGLNGAYVSVLARFFNPDHWAEELRHYRPDLVIVNYGTNESMYANFVDYAYVKEMKEIIRRLRAAVPETSILVMSPMDRGQRDATGEIGTVPVLPRLVAMQQRVANDTGCAFFNTFEAMGGPGTMGRWYQAEPRLVGGDFIHPMPAGARLVGGLLYRALVEGYNRYKLDRMQNKLALDRTPPPVAGAGPILPVRNTPVATTVPLSVK